MSVVLDPNADLSREVNYLCSKSAKIATAIAKIHPSGLTPSVGPVLTRDPTDYSDGFKISFPLTFEDGTEWLITFPHTTTTYSFTVRRRIESEVATLKWLKQHTTLPVPTVHGWCTAKRGKLKAILRPCIVLDRMPGKPVTNNDWKKLTEEQQIKVCDQLARIKGELLAHHFGQIGSLWTDKKKGFKVGTLVTHQVNRYCQLHGGVPRLLKLFKTEKAPYDTAMEYFVDMANMRLLHEAIGSNVPNLMHEHFVEWWIYRSMLPSLVYEKADRGPFVMGHGMLNQKAVLFDDEFNLSGVINWEYSLIEPLQLCATYPPVLLELTNGGSKLHVDTYITSLRKYEQEFREKKEQKNDIAPHIDYLLKRVSTLHNVAVYSGFPRLYSTAGLWEFVFQPNFGAIDKASFLKIYGNAPGLLEEFKRMRVFLESKEVNSYH